jgi:hypothetical protein
MLAAVPALSIAKGPVREPITLTYLGNAGWQIEDGHTVIIVDPYVSQFHDKRMGNPNTSDDSDDVLVPDEAQIAAHIPRADFLLVTHSHSDHMLDAPTVAKRTGALIIGSEGSANIARVEEVSEKQLIIVKGGDDLDFGRFTLRVIPSLHSQLFAKHYNNSEFSGPVVSGLKAPLHEICVPRRWDLRIPGASSWSPHPDNGEHELHRARDDGVETRHCTRRRGCIAEGNLRLFKPAHEGSE